MTLRSKTLAIIGLTLAGMTAVTYAVLSPLLLSSYAALEDRDARNQLARAVDALRAVLMNLDERAASTAEWNDTYAFVKDRNPAYVDSVLVDNTFEFGRLNLITIVNATGEVVFEKAFDLERNAATRIPRGWHQQLSADGPLLRVQNPRGTQGVLVLPDGPMLIVARPILDSNGNGPARGRFIMGRFLNAGQIQRLAGITHLSIGIQTISDPELPPNVVAELMGSGADPAAIRPRNVDTLDAYRAIRDIYGRPALVMHLEMPRDIYQGGMTSIRYVLASLLGAGLIFGIVTLCLIEKFVLSRLQRLSAGVARIGGSGDPTIRLPTPGGDEVARLGAAINQMLDALERSQALVAEREERFQVVARATTDAIWDWDLRTDRVWWNENVEPLFGYAAGDIGPDITWWHEHLHPDDRGRVVSGIQAAINGAGQKWSSEYRFRSADGSYSSVLDRGYVLRDQGGIPVRMIGAIVDLTERTRADEAVLKLAALVESSDDAIYGYTMDGTITAWNTGAERIYGYSAAEVLGKSGFLVVHDAPDELRHSLEMIARGEHIRNLETSRTRRDGRRIDVALTVSPLKAADGRITGASAIVRDITGRKLLEDQLRQSQKMEALGGLAGGIAHDFNNLLTAIIGYSELVLDRLAEDDPLRADITEISKAADRAALLTRQLLAFSRRQMLRPEVLDLNAVLADMSAMLRRVIGEDVSLVTSFDAALARVRADPGQIAQVIMNLAVNARDAMPAGGTLTLETANIVVSDGPTSEDMPIPPGRYVRLTVSDTGTGMDAETRGRAFEPFYTTKEQGKGTGLGLSTVYGIVKQSGGYVSVESQTGSGTRFKICLPDAGGGAERAPLDGVGICQGGTETILLVEDEDTVRALARKVLTHHGYRVIDAGHPYEAQSLFEEHGDAIDLLLTDVTMPGMSGVDLARHLTAVSPRTKILYMSGYANTQLMVVADDTLEPRAAFLQKPFTPDTLARKVREVLAADSVGLRLTANG